MSNRIGTYTARIRLNRTGTEVNAPEPLFEGSTIETLQWFWTEGNFGCDCNRSLEFRRALYPNGPNFWNDTHTRCGGWRPWSRTPVSGRARYMVLWLDMPDGTRVAIDDEPHR